MRTITRPVVGFSSSVNVVRVQSSLKLSSVRTRAPASAVAPIPAGALVQALSLKIGLFH
jgi:hypothetical protein